MISPQRAVYEKNMNNVLRSAPAEQRIVRYFPDVHLGNGHDGLGQIAKAQGVNVRNLQKGEYVIFVNKSKSGLKMFAPGYIVAYLKVPGKLDLRIISMIPRFFNGQKINYDAALEQRLRRDFKIQDPDQYLPKKIKKTKTPSNYLAD